jgi:hypothetical protein
VDLAYPAAWIGKRQDLSQVGSPSDRIATRIAEIWLADGIIRAKFLPSKTHTIEDARAVTAAINTLADGRRLPVLGDIRQILTGLDKNARNYYASQSPEEATEGRDCIASGRRLA